MDTKEAGRRGGEARAKSLTREQRIAIAKKANAASQKAKEAKR